MARIRTIKPEFFEDARMAADLTITERLFYVGLWCQADDKGRFLAHPRRLLGALFPYDRELTEDSLSDSLRTLCRTRRIVLYEVNGEPYGELVNFLKHQRINRPTPSKIPSSSSPLARLTEDSLRAHGGLTEGSLPERKGKEQGTGKGTGKCSYEHSSTTEAVDPPMHPENDTKPKQPDCPHQKIIDLYHSTCPELPQVNVWTNTNRANLRQRWLEDRARQSIDWWQSFLDRVAESDFLMGRAKEFRANLGWLVGPKNFAKVLNGQYDNRAPHTGPFSAHNTAVARRVLAMIQNQEEEG